MQDRVYLLSLEDWQICTAQDAAADEHLEALLQRACNKLDGERRKKAELIRKGKKKLESIGAGLLLQKAVQDALEEKNISFCKVTIEELLEQIDSPLLLEYTYGAAGKPYLKNYPFYFSISHSGNYVLCVLSEQEIGADIQLRTPKVQEALLQRFFSEEEIAYWKQCATEEDKDTFFYRMWCRKEAYGKLTGEGIIKAVGINMLLPEPVVEDTPIVISEYSLENYQIAICKQKLQ